MAYSSAAWAASVRIVLIKSVIDVVSGKLARASRVKLRVCI